MARTAQGLQLVWRGGIATVRFQVQGKRYAISTLQRDPVQAEKVAARLYEEAVSRRVKPEPSNGHLERS